METAAMPSEARAQFGMIGMAVMGRNLALNILDHDYSVAGYNLEPVLMQQAVEGHCQVDELNT